jgi:hypothetical protein
MLLKKETPITPSLPNISGGSISLGGGGGNYGGGGGTYGGGIYDPYFTQQMGGFEPFLDGRTRIGLLLTTQYYYS